LSRWSLDSVIHEIAWGYSAPDISTRTSGLAYALYELDDTFRVRFSATLGEEPEVEVALV
jgi:hypothetical protein